MGKADVAVALRFVFRKNVAPEIRDRITRKLKLIAGASSYATTQTAKVIERKGRANIAAAGRFGRRWQEGLKARRDPPAGTYINNSIVITHNVLGARLFEFGGTVEGRPLLWLPLSFAGDAQGIRAADYGKRHGLFKVERNGKPPLLLSLADRQPKYVGIQAVTIKRKWNIRGIAQQSMRSDFRRLYDEYIARKGGG